MSSVIYSRPFRNLNIKAVHFEQLLCYDGTDTTDQEQLTTYRKGEADYGKDSGDRNSGFFKNH